ncbi:MAG TPA: hypothetical protein DEF34_09645 [Desulfotomaculum sp.]|nr:hypothetical protein [Desulfotomaculum sp.]
MMKKNILYLVPVYGLIILSLILCVVFKTLLPLGAVIIILLMSLIIWRPIFGLYLIVFLIPLEHLTALNSSLTLVKLISITTFWGWLMQLLMGKKTVKPSSFLLLLAAYFLWACLSVTWAMEPEPAWKRIISDGQLVLFLFLGYNLVENKKEVYFLLGGYLLGALISAGLGIFETYGAGLSTRAAVSDLQNPNLYARLLGLGLIFGVYLFITQRNTIIRALCSLSCLAILWGVLLSGSRGAWVAIMVVVVMGIFLYRDYLLKLVKKPPVLVGLVVIVLAMVIMSPFLARHVPAVVLERVPSFNALAEDRGTSRLDIWLVGIEAARDNIFKGVGIENFPYAYTKYLQETEGAVQEMGVNKSPHNIFIGTLTELGMPGLIMLICLFIAMWRLGGRTENRADAVLCKLIVVFLAVAGLTGGDQHRKFFWLALMLPVIMAQFGVLGGSNPPLVGQTKMLFLAPVFPNRNNPGYGIFVFRLVQSLVDSGVSVSVVAPVPYAPFLLWFNKKWRQMGRLPVKENINGIEVIHPRYLCLPGGRFDWWNMLFMYWSVYPVVRVMADRYAYDVLHSYGLLPGGFVGQQMAQRLNLVTVATIMGGDINVAARKSSMMLKSARYVLNKSDQVVAVGDDLAKKASALLTTNKGIKVVYNGVDTGMFDTCMNQAQAKTDLGFAPADRIILYVGRIIRQKGVFELLDAFTRLTEKVREARLVFVGAGEDERALGAQARESGVSPRVYFAGTQPHEELVKWYTASEMVVLFSHHDGVPNVLKEAMGCGKPVVASKISGIPELVVHGETGLLVEPQNINQMVTAMEKLLSDPELGRQMGQNAREVITSGPLNWQETAKSYRIIYNQLIN